MSFKDGSERVPHGIPAYWPKLPMAIGSFILDSHMSMSITMKILERF